MTRNLTDQELWKDLRERSRRIAAVAESVQGNGLHVDMDAVVLDARAVNCAATELANRASGNRPKPIGD